MLYFYCRGCGGYCVFCLYCEAWNCRKYECFVVQMLYVYVFLIIWQSSMLRSACLAVC